MLMPVLMFLKSAWFSGPEKGRFGVAEFPSRSVSAGSRLSAPGACVGMCRRPTVCSDAAWCLHRQGRRSTVRRVAAHASGGWCRDELPPRAELLMVLPIWTICWSYWNWWTDSMNWTWWTDACVRVRVTLRLTVSLSVLVSSPVWGSWPDIYFEWKLQSCPYGAPSLTRGRVCHLSAIVDRKSLSIHIFKFSIIL
jgi:hypothetical protein